MNRNIFLIIILFTTFPETGLFGIYLQMQNNFSSNILVQDTTNERQILYNGTIWTNRYHRIKGDQFLFSGLFLPATVSKNGKTFKNVSIKYDIYSDEIITPVNSEDILQLNKEMVDSFTLSFENKTYKFTNIQALRGISMFYTKGNQLFTSSTKKPLHLPSHHNQTEHLIKPTRYISEKGTISIL